MTAIRRVAESPYLCISAPDQDDWVMRPESDPSPVDCFGISPSGIVWVFSSDRELLFYRRTDGPDPLPMSRVQIPQATDHRGQASTYYSLYNTLRSPDGRMLYIVVRHYIETCDLIVVSVERQEVVARFEGLPAIGPDAPILEDDGRLLYASRIKDGPKRGAGLTRIDPRSGQTESALCTGSPVGGVLHSPSPSGRYWLRADDSRLAILHGGAAGLEVDDCFSPCLELWEGYPPRRVGSLTTLWLTAPDLPDEGSYDTTVTRDPYRIIRRDIPQRGEIYRLVARILDSDPALTVNHFTPTRPENAWPDEDFFRKHVSSNMRRLKITHLDVAGWQPDERAFWLQRDGFVCCVGIDGSVSPRTTLERCGVRPVTNEPKGAGARRVTPLPDRRAELLLHDGIAIVSGHPEAPTAKLRVVSKSDDQWRLAPDDKALAKRVEATMQKMSVYQVTLKSLQERDCIAAIEDLTRQIGPDMVKRAYENQLQAVFTLDRERLGEDRFFGHVSETCPSAAGPLRALIEAYCDHFVLHAEPYWQPEEGIGAFGHAALALAKLAPDDIAVLRRYGDTVDTGHEYFFMRETLPVLMDHLGTSDALLDLAEWGFFEMLGNCFMPGEFWRNTPMGRVAQALYTPEGYAARLAARTLVPPEDPKLAGEHGHIYFDILKRDLRKDPTAWEQSFLEVLRARQ